MRCFWSVILLFPPSPYSFYFKLKTWHLGFFFIFIPEITAHVLRSMSTRLYVPLYNISNAWQVRSFWLHNVDLSWPRKQVAESDTLNIVLHGLYANNNYRYWETIFYNETNPFNIYVTQVKRECEWSLTFKTTKEQKAILKTRDPLIKSPNCPNGIAKFSSGG